MKILFITRGSMVGTNNSGNTLINIFSSMRNIEFYNLFMRAEKPNTTLCVSSCQISEMSLIRHLRYKQDPVKVTHQTDMVLANIAEDMDIDSEQSIYRKSRGSSSRLKWFVRELIWNTDSWKNETLNAFLADVSPDLIFMPAYGCLYVYQILQYVHRKCLNVPVFLYHFDDNYSLHQFNFFPSFWLYRLLLRKKIRAAEKISAKTYVISEVQKIEYEKAFRRDCSILTKGSVYREVDKCALPLHTPISLCYTGNLGDGRLGILLAIGKAVRKQGILQIYSATPLSEQQQSMMKNIPSIRFHGRIEPDRVRSVQEGADVLVHVESFSRENRALARMSVSTKLFDYMNIPKCILAVGPADVASIKLLSDHGAAVTVTELGALDSVLSELLSNPARIQYYAEKAWNYGKNHLDIDQIHAMLQADIEALGKK